MGGYKLIVVTGIDGDDSPFEKVFSSLPYRTFHYSRCQMFRKNREKLISEIEKIGSPVILLGWSIGAALSLSVASTFNVETIISINSFYDRKAELEKRNIIIPTKDNVIVTNYTCDGKEILFVCGLRDTKIDPCNSKLLYEEFRNTNDTELIEDLEMSHELDSMSITTITYLTRVLKDKLWTGC